MDAWGIDGAVAGSQKGLMLPAGLGLSCFSPKALDASRAARGNHPLRRSYFDIEAMRRSNATGYFPYTPSLPLLYGLRESLRMLFEEGLEQVFARHARLAAGVRAAVLEGWRLPLCAAEPNWHSDTVSAVLVPEGFDAAAVIARAFARYNLSLGSGLAQVAGRLFRIGHLGDLNELMCLAAITGAEMAMQDIGIKVEPGSGAAAAQRYYRQGEGAALDPLGP
jgi:alanine-glyoxylate transaminase/serine-glyoxylate transaminase/serine-pyruvate transaminase